MSNRQTGFTAGFRDSAVVDANLNERSDQVPADSTVTSDFRHKGEKLDGERFSLQFSLSVCQSKAWEQN